MGKIFCLENQCGKLRYQIMDQKRRILSQSNVERSMTQTDANKDEHIFKNKLAT